jgi:hypothetical protein
MKQGILPPPVNPLPLFRICPSCKRWFAMRIVRPALDQEQAGTVLLRCKHCGKEATFSEPRPPECL